MELWDAYNESGEKLGFDLVRGQQIPDGVYHLVCEVVVQGTGGDFLLMQRSWEKEIFPGNWEIGAGGSALKGEDALTGAHRELLEEIGIDAAGGLRELYHIVHQKHHAIYQGYLLVTDWPKEKIVLQAGETIAYKWLSREEFLDFYDKDGFIGFQKERLREFVDEIRSSGFRPGSRMDIQDKSIEELEDYHWEDSDFDSYVVQTCQRARKKPLSQLSGEEVRLLLGQKIGLRWLIPVALSIVDDDPLVQITYFEGDLLLQLFRLSDEDWEHNREDLECFRAIIRENLSLIRSCREIPDELLAKYKITRF